jgi:exopolysaccharide biosynthesis predicted pyruvyltransferase EpsI
MPVTKEEVVWCYRAILGREPESEQAIQGHQAQRDIASLRDVFLKSREFRSIAKELSKDNELLIKSKLAERVCDFEKLFNRYRNFSASSLDVANFLLDDCPPWSAHRKFLDEINWKTKKIRILVFGAYGNGNMGDAYQALAIRSHLKKYFNFNDTDIFACSVLESSDYPFPEMQKLPSSSFYNFDLINSFDFLVIGGGGLLAHIHDPLTDENWYKQVSTPIILLGVGASKKIVLQHSSLLEHAIFVSGRDQSSCQAISEIRSDVVLVPDPIISLSEFDILAEFDTPHNLSIPRFDMLWILKYPADENDFKILSAINEMIGENAQHSYSLICIEPQMDCVLDDLFPNENVIYTYSFSELISYINCSSAVFSMRFHGAIFGLLLKKPLFGSSQIKILELFESFNAGGSFIDSAEGVEKIFDSVGFSMGSNELSWCHDAFSRFLKKLKIYFLREI